MLFQVSSSIIAAGAGGAAGVRSNSLAVSIGTLLLFFFIAIYFGIVKIIITANAIIIFIIGLIILAILIFVLREKARKEDVAASICGID